LPCIILILNIKIYFMPANKGHEKKGGRAKGTGNRLSPEVKTVINEIVKDYITLDEIGQANIKGDLQAMRPVDRITAVLKLMSFVMPTMGTMKVEAGDGQPMTVLVKYTDKPKAIDDDENDIDYSEEL